MRRWLAGGLLAVGLSLQLGADGASACSCAAEPITAGTFRESDGAIIGHLTDVEVREPEGAPGEPVPTSRPAKFHYRIVRVFRGRHRIEDDRIVVRSESEEASCGLPRRKRRSYGLFLARRGGHWRGGLCAVTSPRKMRRAAERSGFARTRRC